MGKIKDHIFTEEVNQLSQMARVLASPARIAILEHLSNSHQCVCNDLVKVIGLAQPTITQHLNELKKAGLVHVQYEGSNMCLCIVPARWKEFKKSFHTFFESIKPQSC